MKSYSQAGQDIFVRRLMGDRKGIFLDIGCGNEQYSNTLALEEEGWTGWLVDNGEGAGQNRKAPFFRCNAIRPLPFILTSYVDYLSLDIDEGTLDALKALPLESTRFGIITIEHDAYRFGDSLRLPQYEILHDLGYHLVCGDVSNPVPFEDWWVDSNMLEAAKPFASRGKQWTEILADILPAPQ